MNIFDSLIFRNISSITSSFWSDPAGKIFLATFFAYSVSYMIYSGYLARFSGTFGGTFLSQAGFTALDFLSLIPGAALLIVESTKSLFLFAVKYIFAFVILPWIVGFIIIGIRMPVMGQGSAIKSYIGVIALMVWISTATYPIFHSQIMRSWKRTAIYSALVTLPLIVFAFCVPIVVPNSASESGNLTAFDNILLELMAFAIVIIAILMPFIIGEGIANIAIENKLLGQIKKLVLRQPIYLPGALSVINEMTNLSATGKESHWLLNKKLGIYIQPDVYSYSWPDEITVFLVASFNRTTAVYIHKEGDKKENKMIYLDNSLIYLMELKSKK